MQFKITDVAAITFTRTFYQVLAQGGPIDGALAQARQALSLEGRTAAEWGTPHALHARAGRTPL